MRSLYFHVSQAVNHDPVVSSLNKWFEKELAELRCREYFAGVTSIGIIILAYSKLKLFILTRIIFYPIAFNRNKFHLYKLD